MVLGVLLLTFAGIAAFEAPQLVRERCWKELITAGAVWLLALVYSALQVLHWPYPDVNAPIKLLFGRG